jgi:hypothetical protein
MQYDDMNKESTPNSIISYVKFSLSVRIEHPTSERAATTVLCVGLCKSDMANDWQDYQEITIAWRQRD